jgi:hypothetical protein
MDPSHLLVGAMTLGAFVFLIVVELHSRRRTKQLKGSADLNRSE